MVSEVPDLRDPDGYPIASKETAFLCRCGASKNKPFCDGSHKAIGFSGEPDAEHPRNKPIAYKGHVDGVDVTVSYTPMLCTHAAECQRLQKSVFSPARKPWIQPENGTLAGIRAVVFACPSGALSMSEGDGAPQQLGPDSTTTEIRVEKNGPYAVRNVPLEATFNGANASEQKYMLCRCGASKNKPFCDGTHHDIKWKDDA